MNITKLLTNNMTRVEINSSNQESAFAELSKALFLAGYINDKDNFLKDVLAREEIASTFMENNIAIPHAKSKYVNKTSIALGISKNGVVSNGNTTKIFFMIGVPEHSSNEHLEIISSLARFLAEQDFCLALQQTTNKQEVIALFTNYNKINTEVVLSEGDDEGNKLETLALDLVAITACTVGIAHTYWAAEYLEKTALKMGLKIKVQTNGSIGLQNTLTKKDINQAKAVIIASDIDIDETPFSNKPIIKVSPSIAISKTQEIITKAIQAKPKKHYTDNNIVGEEVFKEKAGFYKHLLSGVSFMIPFVVAGGVLIALAIALSGITPNQGAVITHPFYKQIFDLGVLSFSFMVPILAGYIAFSVGGKPALLSGVIGGSLASSVGAGFLGGILAGFFAGYTVKWIVKISFHKTIQTIVPVLIIPIISITLIALFMFVVGSPIAFVMKALTDFLQNMKTGSLVLFFVLGLMMAADMGGPINKVAFLFGASLISAGVPEVMGAVAVAACIPPLGLALATVIAPKKYSTDEKQAGKAAFAMGLIGITEGAIPFAALDPFRVIPAIMLGSGVGATIAGFFAVKDYAPHGGPIVLPVVDGKLMFIAAIIIGVLVTAILVNLLKKNKIVVG